MVIISQIMLGLGQGLVVNLILLCTDFFTVRRDAKLRRVAYIVYAVEQGIYTYSFIYM